MKMFLQHLLMLVMLVASSIPGSASEQLRKVSGVNRGGRMEGRDPVLTASTPLLTTCLHKCYSLDGCVALQFNAGEGICELLNTSLCDGGASGTSLTGEEAWRYYDVHDDVAELSGDVFHDQSMCTAEGKCSAKCARSLGEPCERNEQCLAVAAKSHCNDTEGGQGYCVCGTHHWPYNGSLCVLTEAWTISNWQWFGKTIVNGVCELTLSMIMVNTLEILLGSKGDWVSGTKDARFYIGYTGNTRSSVKANGVNYWGENVTLHSGPVFNGSLQNFTISFCNGEMRFGYQGEEPFVVFDNPTPFDVTYIGFRGGDKKNNGYLYVPHSLVDPHFPLSVETKTLRTNGNFYTLLKLTPSASLITSFTLKFSYQGPADARLLFFKRDDTGHQYQLRILQTQVHLHINGIGPTWFLKLNATDLTSETEFRHFWVIMNEGKISFGRMGDAAPVLSYEPDASFPVRQFSRIAVYHCCGRSFGYWRFPSHPEFHEHSLNGYYAD